MRTEIRVLDGCSNNAFERRALARRPVAAALRPDDERVGIDSAVPDKVLKMPSCDPKDPSVIPHDAQPCLKLAPSTRHVSVELTYRDGGVSETKSFRR